MFSGSWRLDMASTTPFMNELVRTIVGDAATEREQAVRIHDYVRDRVRYGFTPRFDEATPGETLAAGVGHCNPQTRLFVEMARTAGLEARFHFVTIAGEILRGVQPNVPALISHGFAEVKVDGRWRKVDSYIVDPAHAAGALARLEREGREVGYGFHRRGTVVWDGASDAFSQLADPAMIVADHGTWDRAEDFFRSPGYEHRLGPLSFSSLLGALPAPMFALWRGLVDRRLDAVRLEGSAAGPAPVFEPALAAA
jgi:hypothetical protein